MDPLGGSYFLEVMTDQLESGSYDYFRRIEDVGGVIPALETGFLQREIADAAYIYQMEEDRKERITVGVNEYNTGEDMDIPLLPGRPGGRATANRRHQRSPPHPRQP